ncbi:MAG: bifunctional (p)ppGpp synthetase/guanosine-3',5'-bis(diphosphate) 3'-pyrophosphohydrolase [Myxococcales bacterium]|nr:bifunctional (p)ppGpp synthetase/guanosine-3',5'-bis(diphosphate) 3'-pyrophosphohydrolase [Myxococcales bacterium]
MSRTDLPLTVAEARAFAVRAHGDQRYGEHPYVLHLDEVHDVLREHGRPPLPTTRLVVAYLHDVVEDTDVTLAQIETRFGAVVAGCVDLLTDAPGRNRKERKAATYARLGGVAVADPLHHALVVKAADRLANVRRCVLDRNDRLLHVYRGEHPTFRTAAFRDGLADRMWAELDDLLGP